MAPEGYYPDPSIPGYVRYWNGLSWVPGTSRPAAAVPAARSEETGPVFLDEPAVWQADPLHQAGFGGPRDRRVSWGAREPGPGVSLARPPAEPHRGTTDSSPHPPALDLAGPSDPELPPHCAGEGAALDLGLGGRADAAPAPRRDPEAAGPSPQSPGFDPGRPVDAQAPHRRGGLEPQDSEPPLRRGGEAQGSASDFGGPLDAEVPLRRGDPEPRGTGLDPWGPADADVPPRRGREDAGASPQGAEHDRALPSDPWNRSAPEEAPRRPPGPDGTPPAPAAPAHAWPEAAGASMSGMTSSWPEAEPRREPGPPRADEPWSPRADGPWPPRAAGTRPVLPRPADSPPREATRRPAEPAPLREDEPWPPRPEGTRPVLPRPAEAAPSRGATSHPEPWPPREGAGRPAEAAPSRQAPPRADEGWSPRPEGTRPVLPRPADDSAPPRVAEAPPRVDTGRAVFERMAEHAVRPAGLGRRFTARVLDSLVYAAAAYAAAQPLIPGATAHLQAKVDAARVSGHPTTVWLLDATITGRLALVLGAVLLFGILYEVLPTARWGRTPGKGLLGVRVLATATLRPPRFGAALLRWLVYAFLGLPGSLACLANRPRRQAWHDKAAKTYVSR